MTTVLECAQRGLVQSSFSVTAKGMGRGLITGALFCTCLSGVIFDIYFPCEKWEF